MRSFALTALAFLTFGVFASAAPATPDYKAKATDVKRSSSSDKCLDSILTELVSEVDAIIVEISEFCDSCAKSLLLLT